MPFDASHPDYMRPIRDANREEYFLVEFHRTLKNTNYSIVRNLIQLCADDEELRSIFPKLNHFASIEDPNKLYHATVLYNRPEELIRFLSGDQLPPEMCNQFATTLMKHLGLETLHTTRLEYVIHELLQQKFLQKVYIFADKFTTEMQSYLVHTFGGSYFSENRICLVEGNFYDCITAIPEVTSVFISNFADLEYAYDLSPECIRGKMIVISDGYDNLEPLEMGSGPDAPKKERDQPSHKMTYRGLDLFAKWKKSKIAEAGYSYPYCIDASTSEERK